MKIPFPVLVADSTYAIEHSSIADTPKVPGKANRGKKGAKRNHKYIQAQTTLKVTYSVQQEISDNEIACSPDYVD